uniref:Uncharacterized protein n=1 Tax=Arundo donax TaxID=35708 RepID=A0A0A9D3Z1_ARUDO
MVVVAALMASKLVYPVHIVVSDILLSH